MKRGRGRSKGRGGLKKNQGIIEEKKYSIFFLRVQSKLQSHTSNNIELWSLKIKCQCWSHLQCWSLLQCWSHLPPNFLLHHQTNRLTPALQQIQIGNKVMDDYCDRNFKRLMVVGLYTQCQKLVGNWYLEYWFSSNFQNSASVIRPVAFRMGSDKWWKSIAPRSMEGQFPAPFGK